MIEHIHKCSDRNQTYSQRLKELQMYESEVKNKLDVMTTENNNITMRLRQKVEQIERENNSLIHDISSVPIRSPTKTRQDEIEELNQLDDVTQQSVNEYSRKVQARINSHSDEINEEFEAMQIRLKDHFKNFAISVRDKFEREVIQDGINQEFDKLSPIKRLNTNEDEQYESDESHSHLSGVNDSEEECVNDDCLSPEIRDLKNNLLQTYSSPLKECQSAINTTADFRKTSKIEKDLEHMDPIERSKKKDRSVSVEQQLRRDQMKQRLGNFKMKGTTCSNSGLKQDMIKSVRLLNAFDSADPYPDLKYTNNVVTPSAQNIGSSPLKTTKHSLSRTKSAAAFKQNNVRRKKDDLVKTLLFSNRNR